MQGKNITKFDRTVPGPGAYTNDKDINLRKSTPSWG